MRSERSIDGLVRVLSQSNSLRADVCAPRPSRRSRWISSSSVLSAGTVSDGSPPIIDAIRMLASHGLDVSGHRSRRIDEQLVRSADLIVTAEKHHVVAIAGRWPDTFQCHLHLARAGASGRNPRRSRRSSNQRLAERDRRRATRSRPTTWTTRTSVRSSTRPASRDRPGTVSSTRSTS